MVKAEEMETVQEAAAVDCGGVLPSLGVVGETSEPEERQTAGLARDVAHAPGAEAVAQLQPASEM
jgi:hypothetical protein